MIETRFRFRHPSMYFKGWDGCAARCVWRCNLMQIKSARRSAKPLFGGSIPPRASNNLQILSLLSPISRCLSPSLVGERLAKRWPIGVSDGVERLQLLPPFGLLNLPVPERPNI